MCKEQVSTIETKMEINRLMETETVIHNAIGLGDIWIEIINYTNPEALIKEHCSLNTPYGGQRIDKMDIALLIQLLAHVMNELEY